ncbi:MAG: hypothetical protein U9P14_07415, partial [Gemmatimonadota bacterium]|nr:hypothetical protein [Gemmatimonadota bacterium]
DNLYAKALVLSDGSTEVAIVSADLVGVTAGIVSAVRESVAARTGIPGENILITATHTHFGPVIKQYKFDAKIDPAYLEVLTGKLAAAIAMAHDNLAAVRVGTSRGQAPELLYNRRTKEKNGKVVMSFVLPPPGSELTFGPIDPAVGVLRVEDDRGNLVASMINFGCHPVSGGGHGEGWESWFYDISADYPAYATQVVEEIEGGNCLFTLGLAGNTVPIRRGVRPRFEIGRALGGEALRRLQLMDLSEKTSLAAVQRKITLPLKKDVGENSNSMLKPGQTGIATEIQGIRIGDTVLLGLPGEVLVEVGLAIREKCPDDDILFLTLSNDSIGYICHSAAYEEGGYEPGRGTLLAQGAAEIMVDEAVEVDRKLKIRL